MSPLPSEAGDGEGTKEVLDTGQAMISVIFSFGSVIYSLSLSPSSAAKQDNAFMRGTRGREINEQSF